MGRVFPGGLLGNVLPLIGDVDAAGHSGEEQKLRAESRRILKRPDLSVESTCVRVPTRRAHGVALHLDVEADLTQAALRGVLEAAPGLEIGDEATPRAAAGRHEVLAGRLRFPEGPSGRRVALFVVGDQLLKGAALNALQIALTLP